VVGRGLGENARAALLTRGLAEITRLGVAKGAKPETFMGLSGLGDLALTCSSPQSRNMSLGIAIGPGRTLADILAERRSVAERVRGARAREDGGRRHADLHGGRRRASPRRVARRGDGVAAEPASEGGGGVKEK